MSAHQADSEDRTRVFTPRGDSFVHALDGLERLDTTRPPPMREPWANDPTVMAGASYNSEKLDAHALFAGVLPSVEPPTVRRIPTPMMLARPRPQPMPAPMPMATPIPMAMPVAMPMQPPPSQPPSFDFHLMQGNPRSTVVTTVRRRRPSSWLDSQHASITAVAICFGVGLGAAIAAVCMF